MAKTSTTAAATSTGLLEQHPLAIQLTPGTMPDDEFDAFCDDIKARGQKHDIIKYEGKVLDGMHRYRACLRNGITPKFGPDYEGDDPAGLVISLNVLRRKLGTTQRALAGARLNIDYGVGQDEAAKRVGVSKVHVNLVVQALKSNNSRVIKMLENPDLTRTQLHEAMVDSEILRPSGTPQPATASLSAAGATAGLDAFFRSTAGDETDDDDLLGGADDVDLDDVLGDPPSAGGKVISTAKPTSEGGMPVTGHRPSHPERRTRDTPASLLAERFKGLSENDQVSFIQIAWPTISKLAKVAGVQLPSGSEPAKGSPAAKVAQATTSAAIAKAATTSASVAKAHGKGGKGGETADAGATPAKGSKSRVAAR